MKRLVGHAVVLLAIVSVTLAGNALAFFTSSGSGTASAAVTKLNAPTISAATAAAGGTVSLSWGAVSAPDASSVAYYVTRDGGDAAGTCPTKAAPAAVTSCKDSRVAIGEHTYKVIAVWHTWSAASTAKAATITVGEATKFTIAGSTTTPAAGGAVNLTITAKDVNNSTVTTYTGAHSLVFAGAESSPAGNAPTVVNSGGTAVAFGTATSLSFSSGVATVSSSKNGVLKVYDADAANVTAAEGSITTPTPLALTVSPAAASKFVLAAASATPAVAETDGLTITAQDTYGNIATGYAGSKSLTFSGASAGPSGTAPTVTNSSGTAVAFGSATAVLFGAGVAVAGTGVGGEMVLYKSGATTVKVTEGSITTSTGLVVTVAPGAAAKLALSASTTTPTAGTGFNVTTTALDLYGNTATAYTGSKNIVFSGASASPGGTLPTVVDSGGTAINFGGATALTFSSGVATPASSKNGFMKLGLAGATSVSATDGTLATATPLALTVTVGAAAKLALSELAVSAGTIGSPCYFTCAVSALGNAGTVKAKVTITDSMGNVVSSVGAAKTVTVTASGGTIGGSPLTVPASGIAVSGTPFTYTAPASGSFTNTITAASSGYTSATVTASK